MSLLSFGSGFGGFGGGRWERARQRELLCNSHPATVVSDLPASSQTVPECPCTECKINMFCKNNALTSPSLDSAYLGVMTMRHIISGCPGGVRRPPMVSQLHWLCGKGFRGKGFLKNNEKNKKEWKEDLFENPYQFPLSLTASDFLFISVAQQCGDFFFPLWYQHNHEVKLMVSHPPKLAKRKL